MELLTGNQWNQIKNTAQNISDTVCKKPVLWYKCKNALTPFMETPNQYTYVQIELLGILNYNYLRSWPISENTVSGEIDKQSVQVLLNKKVLLSAGFLDINNKPIYNPAMDRIVIDGYLYKPSGDTWASQIDETDAFFTMVMKRDQITGVIPVEGGFILVDGNGNPILTGGGDEIQTN